VTLNVKRIAPFLVAISLSGCGSNLGKFDFEKLELVSLTASQKINLEWRRCYPDDSKLLKLTISSTADLTKKADFGTGVYVKFDFCSPFWPEDYMSIGPFFDDLAPNPSGGVLRKPVRSSIRNKFIYTAYIDPVEKGRDEEPGLEAKSAYDLFKQPRQICARITNPNFMSGPSNSDDIIITRDAVLAATIAAESKRAPEAP
jgi:hypothetical protein